MAAQKRFSLLMLPAIILGVFVPMLVDGPVRMAFRVVGLALFVAAIVAFFRTGKAAHDDYTERRHGKE